MSEVPIANPPLSAAEAAIAAALSRSELAEIDATVLSQSHVQWRKVARVVMNTLDVLSNRHPGLSDVFYAERVQHLVAAGQLESQGNLSYMRFSEVRLPQSVKQPV